MTQTHILVGLAAFGRPKRRLNNALAVAGGIVPDAAIFFMYGIEKLKGTREGTIWRDVYFGPFWQDVVAWGNSIPLWLVLLGMAWLLSGQGKQPAGGLLAVFAGSCLAHMALDFPVHVEDAHRHLFPLSDFRFRSPVSYWDPRHFGVQMAIFESLMGIGLSVFLMRRFNNLIGRIGIVVLLLGYLAVPTYFAIQFVTATYK